MEAGRDPLREQYELEKELAGQLRSLPAAARPAGYAAAYERLYRLQVEMGLTKPTYGFGRFHAELLRRVARVRGQRVLEIGCGTGAASVLLAGLGNSVVAVDVSADLLHEARKRAGRRDVEFVQDNAVTLGRVTSRFDLAYSNDLVEHLHPEDLHTHLHRVHELLKDGGGGYLIVTPNRLYGPHDISRFFGHQVAAGLHLKEYSYAELRSVLLTAGYAEVQALPPLLMFTLTVHSRIHRWPVCGGRPGPAHAQGYAHVEYFLERVPRRRGLLFPLGKFLGLHRVVLLAHKA